MAENDQEPKDTNTPASCHVIEQLRCAEQTLRLAQTALALAAGLLIVTTARELGAQAAFNAGLSAGICVVLLACTRAILRAMRAKEVRDEEVTRLFSSRLGHVEAAGDSQLGIMAAAADELGSRRNGNGRRA